MEIKIPELSLVILIGVSGSGKSSFAKRNFKRTEVISSDECRALVSDDENNQSATTDAFDVLNYIVSKRLKNGLLTVIDATNVQKESRKSIIELARKYHFLPIGMVLDIPENICNERNKSRKDRNLGDHVIRQQSQQLKKSIKYLKEEGFKQVYILKSTEEVEQVTEIVREKLYNNKTEEHGPFDIIGDIHGCLDELIKLLTKLGYIVNKEEKSENHFGYNVISPPGRKVIFLGDLVDRGPDSTGVLRLVMSMVNSGVAYCVPGNHDSKLQKYLNGRKVQINHGLEITVKQFENENLDFKKSVEKFLFSLISHYVFDDGNLVVSHAGLKEEMHGRGSSAVRSFCLYGETTGEIDEFGLPVRYNWAEEYRGKAKVIYGHTPIPSPEWLNKTINIDTGCVFGGNLTALRYPEEELISIKAKKVYYEPSKPIIFNEGNQKLNSQQEYDDLLNIDDVLGKRIIQTKIRNNITIREENSIAALEIMSRFAINPKWLIYLPPTMSPCATSDLPEYLEYPIQALNYYKKRGIEKVVCEKKHMGSRAIIVICKDEISAIKRFGILEEGIGVCYTRTGRNFFNNKDLEIEFLKRVNEALTKSNFWDKFNTDWVCLDSELMPWSLKAISLIKDQYAAVGAAAGVSLVEVEKSLEKLKLRGVNDPHLQLEKIKFKKEAITKYIDSYRNYCWNVNSINDYKLAPFHILATEGETYFDKTHEWHLEKISGICKYDENLLLKTSHRIINLKNESEVSELINWWVELTGNGGEGMVVKPFDFISKGKEGILQPAIKCRGKEYLRIIYGPEYDHFENLERLKKRNLSAKQSLAIREFALGVEGLERFINKEPLRKVHEAVFGVLALESEEVDPRL